MAPPSTYDKITKERSADKVVITRLQSKVEKHDTVPLSGVQVLGLLKQAADFREKAMVQHRELTVAAPTGTDMEPHEKEFCEILDSLDLIENKLETLKLWSDPSINTNVVPTTSNAVIPRTNPSNELKLPKLELPTFNGDLCDWMHFRDMFTASVHNNTRLSDAQKLTYLRSSLSGDASRMLKSISSTNANYTIAWQMLEERYHNTRELFFSVVKRFF